jgi:hypothetical protein
VTALRLAAVATERSSLALVDDKGGFSRLRSFGGFMTCRRIPLSARTRALIDTDRDKPPDHRNKVGASFVESDNSLAVDRTDPPRARRRYTCVPTTGLACIATELHLFSDRFGPEQSLPPESRFRVRAAEKPPAEPSALGILRRTFLALKGAGHDCLRAGFKAIRLST